jgi:NAD+ kinase
MSTREREQALAVRRVAVFTHRVPEVTANIVRDLAAAAERHGVELLLDADEAMKHKLDSDAVRIGEPGEDGDKPDLCIVLGGDGTTLRTLRAQAGSGVPVFSVNCGRVGFLATVDRADAQDGLERALTGQFDVIRLPALLLGAGADQEFAINDVSFQRGAHTNTAYLSFSLAGEEVGRAPCDGLIAATPTGSTAYNLSSGGPILAWDLKGYVIGMVAPHALNVRSVVAAPEDVLRVVNEGADKVSVVIDGMPAGELEPGAAREVRFYPDAVSLAQLPGSTFYGRFREKLRLLTGGS